MNDDRARKGGANIFRDLGFDDIEAEEALAKSELISAIARTIKTRRPTQAAAAPGSWSDRQSRSNSSGPMPA